MATTVKTPALDLVSSQFAKPAVWAILSHVVDPSASAPSLAMSADGLPPTGTPTLMRLPTSSGMTIAQAALFNPACLWVSSPVLPNGEAVQLYSYMTYGSTAPIVLTASDLNQPLTLSAPDPTTDGQVWKMSAAPGAAAAKKEAAKEKGGKTKDSSATTGDSETQGAPAALPSLVYQIENVAIQGAIRRSSAYAVPGSQLELGQGTDQDAHLLAYLYNFVRIA